MSFFFVYLIDRRLNVVLKKYVNNEVERFTHNIVSRAVTDLIDSRDYDDLLINNMGKISYNTKAINKLVNNVSIHLQDKLMELELGSVDDYFMSSSIKSGKYNKVKNGILTEISIGSIRGSSLFANISPTVPIKLMFMGQVNCDLDIKTKEYGINNLMIEVFLIVKIKEQIVMPLSSKKKEIVIREPLSIDIVKGEIPSYYGGYLK